MTGYIRYIWQRRKLERLRREIVADSTKNVAEARKQKLTSGEIDGLQFWNRFDWLECREDQSILEGDRLMQQALRLDVPVPQGTEKEIWVTSVLTGQRFLTMEARAALRTAIRAERKERHEWIGRWVPTAAAILSAFAAWVAALRK